MASNLYRSFPKCKSSQSRSRAELTALGVQLARPHVRPPSVGMLEFAHDAGCPLEARPDAQSCTCAPTIDLLIYDQPGLPPRSVRLMKDGAAVDAPTPEPSR